MVAVMAAVDASAVVVDAVAAAVLVAAAVSVAAAADMLAAGMPAVAVTAAEDKNAQPQIGVCKRQVGAGSQSVNLNIIRQHSTQHGSMKCVS